MATGCNALVQITNAPNREWSFLNFIFRRVKLFCSAACTTTMSTQESGADPGFGNGVRRSVSGDRGPLAGPRDKTQERSLELCLSEADLLLIVLR